MNDDVISLQGVIMRGNQETQAPLSDFMIALEEGIFRNVSLVSSKMETENALTSEFEITAEID